MSLRDLYQEIIIDHGKAPRNFGSIKEATHFQHGHNPICGDKLTVYLLKANNKMVDIRFEGTGCAISLASASLMTEAVKGMSLQEFEKVFHAFHRLMTQGESGETDLGKLEALSGVAEFPVRVKCATLAWHTLLGALTKNEKSISTETE